MTQMCFLTIKEVYSLKHVRLFDSVSFRRRQEQGYLLHLLKCHAVVLDGLDRLVGSI